MKIPYSIERYDHVTRIVTVPDMQPGRRYFHWITNRAIRSLEAEGLIRSDWRDLRNGNAIHLLWHRGFRYPVRAANEIASLVDEYATPAISEAIGQHGEFMVMEAFAKARFVMLGRETRMFEGTIWTRSNHNLDFVFERDGVAYGVEVKNALGYMDKDQLDIKIEMCAYLGLRPVFVVRMLPKSWINEVIEAGGFALVLEHQLYPIAHRELARRVKSTLDLPVDTPKALQDGTIQRFVNWHEIRTSV
jgi:hypothetical protein